MGLEGLSGGNEEAQGTGKGDKKGTVAVKLKVILLFTRRTCGLEDRKGYATKKRVEPE